MELENGRTDDSPVGTPTDEGRQEAARPDAVTPDEALLRRLDRVIALAGKQRAVALHAELLDELRGLVREAEKLPPRPQVGGEEVVERPARRLHGT